MPLTFLAHQAPVLPLKMRRPGRWDGVALVLGSAAPDLAYATSSWGYGPWGIPLWFDGHAARHVLLVAAVVTVFTMVARALVFPVAPLALPDTPLRLHDLTAISATSHRWWTTYLSALVGVITHIVIDGFTHSHGFAVQAVGALSTPILTVGTRDLALYNLLQYGLSLALGLAAAWMFWVIARDRLLLAWSDDGRVSTDRLSAAGRWLVLGCTAIGAVVGGVIGVSRVGVDDFYGTPVDLSWVIGLMTAVWYVLVGLFIGSVLGRPFLRTADHHPRSIQESS